MLLFVAIAGNRYYSLLYSACLGFRWCMRLPASQSPLLLSHPRLVLMLCDPLTHSFFSHACGTVAGNPQSNHFSHFWHGGVGAASASMSVPLWMPPAGSAAPPWQSRCVCIMRRAHGSQGKVQGELPNGRSREKKLVTVTLQVHHAWRSALQSRQSPRGASQWSKQGGEVGGIHAAGASCVECIAGEANYRGGFPMVKVRGRGSRESALAVMIRHQITTSPAKLSHAASFVTSDQADGGRCFLDSSTRGRPQATAGACMVTEVRVPKREIINETAGIVDRPQSYYFWYEDRRLRYDWPSIECIGLQKGNVAVFYRSCWQHCECKPKHGRKLALCPFACRPVAFLPVQKLRDAAT